MILKNWKKIEFELSAQAAAPAADEWDFMDEVDILAKMPADFETNLAASKWTDRRDALQVGTQINTWISLIGEKVDIFVQQLEIEFGDRNSESCRRDETNSVIFE